MRNSDREASAGTAGTPDVAEDVASGAFVTVLASGRSGESSAVYAEARALGRRLAEAGLAVMTGGGRGLMEAVNRGAREAGGRSLGCRVAGRPDEAREPESPYLDACHERETLSARKELLLQGAALVALPGGFGTLDEVFEALALMQRQELASVWAPLPPRVILYPQTFWEPLVAWGREALAPEGLIDAGDVDRLFLAGSLDAVLTAVREDLARRRLTTGA